MEERILVGGDDREIVIEAGVSAENCGTVMSDGLGYLGTSEY
jgi:type IV secretory pathway TrbD component